MRIRKSSKKNIWESNLVLCPIALGGILLCFTILLIGMSGVHVNEGVVTNKYHLPRTHYNHECWIVKIQKGEKCQEIIVSQQTYESLSIGDKYVVQEGDHYEGAFSWAHGT